MNNQCYTCKHFDRHYIKRGLRLVKAVCGACVLKQRSRLKSGEVCKHHQEKHLDETADLCAGYIADILKRLEDIAAILNESREIL